MSILSVEEVQSISNGKSSTYMSIYHKMWDTLITSKPSTRAYCLYDCFSIHNWKGNSVPTLCDVFLRKDQRASFWQEISKHTCKNTTVKSWQWLEVRNLFERRLKIYHSIQHLPFLCWGVVAVQVTSSHWSKSGRGHFFLSKCSSCKYLKMLSK